MMLSIIGKPKKLLYQEPLILYYQRFTTKYVQKEPYMKIKINTTRRVKKLYDSQSYRFKEAKNLYVNDCTGAIEVF